MSDIKSEIVENARWELLRCLALIRDRFPQMGLDGHQLVPLYEGEWRNSKADIWLAAQEASKIGDIELHSLVGSTDQVNRFVVALRGGREAMVRITELRDWIRSIYTPPSVSGGEPGVSVRRLPEGIELRTSPFLPVGALFCNPRTLLPPEPIDPSRLPNLLPNCRAAAPEAERREPGP